MTITPASFRNDLPAFSDVVAYPDSAIAYWAAFGAQFLSVDRWGPGSDVATSPPSTVFDFGLELWVAHNLVLEKMANDSAATGASPGLSQGPASSKSVAGVSISYDTQAGIETDAGHWNLTTYGTRFIRLLRQMGMGPVQITGTAPAYASSSGAWPGPTSGWGAV